jgi:hypothetical protein
MNLVLFEYVLTLIFEESVINLAHCQSKLHKLLRTSKDFQRGSNHVTHVCPLAIISLAGRNVCFTHKCELNEYAYRTLPLINFVVFLNVRNLPRAANMSNKQCYMQSVSAFCSFLFSTAIYIIFVFFLLFLLVTVSAAVLDESVSRL